VAQVREIVLLDLEYRHVDVFSRQGGARFLRGTRFLSLCGGWWLTFARDLPSVFCVPLPLCGVHSRRAGVGGKGRGVGGGRQETLGKALHAATLG